MALTIRERQRHGLMRPRDRKKSWLQQLLNCVPLETIVAELTVLEPNDRPYTKARCFAHGEKTASLTVTPKKNMVHCFGCGLHASDALQLLGYGAYPDFNGWGPKKRVQFLAELAGLKVPPFPKKRRYPRTRKKKKR
jgi:DNA primase